MTFEEFMAELETSVENFREYWQTMHRNERTMDSFPMKMMPGDWWEQFTMLGELE